jgi:sialate O-acetylesterase
MKNSLIAVAFSILLSASGYAAEPTPAKPFLDPVFGSDMVLQRDVADPVWGWTEPGKQVTVSINGKTANATADADGKWLAKVGPLEAGGPFELSVTGPQEVKLSNVLIGDVWICSGQSNMEMGIGNGKDAKEEIANADHPQIRLFTVPRHIAYEPRTDFLEHADEGKWLVCSPTNITLGQWAGFSAVGYFFGRELNDKLKVPIGLIHTSWGGTIAEAWTSAEALDAMPDFAKQLAAIRGPHPKANEEQTKQNASKPRGENPNQVTVLYNGMIAPLEPLAIKGAIWYQGESNAGRAAQYRTLLPTMIRDWRNHFGVGEFPFYIVQLAAFKPESDKPQKSDWAELREAQEIAAKTAGHSAIAVATDIGNAKDIHPKNKQEVGRRLALDALALTYGQNVEYSGPTLSKMDVDGNKAVLHFDHLGGGLEAKGGEALKGFAVSEDGNTFVWADAKIDGDTVVLTSSQVEHPKTVRYDWADNPATGNLFNKAGLPAPPFRTDEPK